MVLNVKAICGAFSEAVHAYSENCYLNLDRIEKDDSERYRDGGALVPKGQFFLDAIERFAAEVRNILSGEDFSILQALYPWDFDRLYEQFVVEIRLFQLQFALEKDDIDAIIESVGGQFYDD